MDIGKLVKTRDLVVPRKLKIARAASYLSVANSFMILFVFVKELYSVPGISERFSFREFVDISYFLAIMGFIVMTRLDWHFMYKGEQSYALTRSPRLPAQCFTALYPLEKALKGGSISEEDARKVLSSLQLAGCGK